MKKESYERTELIVTVFDTEDVILTSASSGQSSKHGPLEMGNNGLSLLPKVSAPPHV